MRQHKFNDLVIGQSVWDMYDGNPNFDEIFGEPIEVLASVRLPVTPDISELIQRTLDVYDAGPRYLNKQLVVINRRWEWGLITTLAWSYDAKSGGFYVIRKKKDPDHDHSRTA